MRHPAFEGEVTREELIDWYRAARARTRQIFDIFSDDAYYDRPIALRNPLVFYEGHLPGFSVNTLIKSALKQKGVDEQLEKLFARGIDPEDETFVRSPTDLWPTRERVLAFGAACDDLIEDALRSATLEDDREPLLRGGEAVFTIIEHELMHHETFLYMLHQLPYEKKPNRGPFTPRQAPRAAKRASEKNVTIPQGRVTLGVRRGSTFGWDNEFPAHEVEVGEFTIDVYDVTNGDYLEFMTATGARAPHFWKRDGDEWLRRGMFELTPLPLDAPVYVTHDEAAAYARWKGKRLPTEAELLRAMIGSPSGEPRAQIWGDAAADETRGNFDFQFADPVDVGCYPEGASAWGLHDLAGNGWKWTSTLFDGFEGFQPMPSYPVYSADFFDGAHYVMLGASPVTDRRLVRPSFRNWFRPSYPYMYATFRCVS